MSPIGSPFQPLPNHDTAYTRQKYFRKCLAVWYILYIFVEQSRKMEFNYQVVRETEKAILAKIPYWEATSESHKTHKQHYFECWIPKYAIENGSAYNIAFSKIEEKRLSNPYQKGLRLPTPEKYKSLGQYAPIKERVISDVIDFEALSTAKKELMVKHGATHYDIDFFINPLDSVDDSVERIAKILRNPENYPNSPLIPKKKYIRYA